MLQGEATFQHLALSSSSGCVRYSGSAPARGHFTFASNGEPTDLPSAVGWIKDIANSLGWDFAVGCIRMAYFNMTGTQQTEALVIYPPVTEPCLLAHYQKATAMMTKPKTNTDGTSIAYLIVEAKGPGQILRRDMFAPPGVGTQMSKAWIVDRLARMLNGKGGQLAGEIFKYMGAKSYVPQHYSQKALGGGKSYYAAAQSGTPPGTNKTVRVKAVTTAVWKKGP